MQCAEILDVLARRKVLINAGRVRQHADSTARFERRLNDADAVDARVAGIRAEYGVEHAQRRRLACAVRPEQPGDAPVERAEAHFAYGLYGAKALRESLDFDHAR